jgi:dipeptidyl aminopeptidase/acylaminoacyl peptidase
MTAQIMKREIGSLILENIPEIPSYLGLRLNHYQNTREAFVMDWIGEPGSLLVSTRFGEAAQLHIVNKQGGARHQLTFFKEPITGAKVCPKPGVNGFLFSKDIGGNENHQFYFFDLDAGDYRLLTDGSSKHAYARWNKDGTLLMYNSTKRNQVDHDLYIYNFAGDGSETLLLAEGGYWIPMAWSPDSSYVTALHFQSINHSDLYVIDVKTGAKKAIVAKQGVACRGGYWTADSKNIYFASDELSECRQLMKYDFINECYSHIPLNEGLELESMALSDDGGKLALVFNDDGYSRLSIWDVAKDEPLGQEYLPLGVISHLCWHPDSELLALTINKAKSPADVYVLDLNEELLSQWTISEVGGLNKDHFIMPDLITYPTFDFVGKVQRHIPAYYYRPKAARAPFPVLIYIHGGPESQYRPVFSSAFQYYLQELGIAIIAPNVRGSTGYGKNYLRLDDGYKREDSVKDIGKLLDWIEQQPELDASRVAVMGGSYGGYMVLASMAHYNDRLACGIDMVGISNFVTFLENTKSYRRSLRRVEYGDERDPKMRRHLHRISPTTNAHKITKPMLIAQGLNDPRVPASEAEQMLKAIRKNGSEAWYVLAKDEGHGFRKKRNRDYFNKAVILFFQKHLLATQQETAKVKAEERV